MNIGSFIKNLAKSKTIQGLVVAGSSLLTLIATDVIPTLPAEALGPYGVAIKAVIGAIGVSGLGYSAHGRINATGPITDKPPVIPTPPAATDTTVTSKP